MRRIDRADVLDRALTRHAFCEPEWPCVTNDVAASMTCDACDREAESIVGIGVPTDAIRLCRGCLTKALALLGGPVAPYDPGPRADRQPWTPGFYLCLRDGSPQRELTPAEVGSAEFAGRIIRELCPDGTWRDT